MNYQHRNIFRYLKQIEVGEIKEYTMQGIKLATLLDYACPAALTRVTINFRGTIVFEILISCATKCEE
jgi:hypothetical protein